MPPEAAVAAGEKPEPTDFFAKDKGSFKLPDAIEIVEDDDAPTPPAAEPAPAAPSDPNADTEEEKARARALDWKDPAEVGTETTRNGKPWLTARQYLERYDPKNLFKKVDELASSFDRRVEERVGTELSSVRGQLETFVKHQRGDLASRYRNWVAQAPTPQESLARQADMDKALAAFDKKFEAHAEARAEPREAPAPAPTFSDAAVGAFRDFETRNASWWKRDSVKTQYAREVAKAVSADPDFAGDPAAEFAEIERRVNAKFGGAAPVAPPPSQPAPNGHAPRKAPDVGGAPRRAASGATGWDALPTAAKQMFKKVHVPFGSFEDTEKDRERYAKQILADTEKKRGFEI